MKRRVIIPPKVEKQLARLDGVAQRQVLDALRLYREAGSGDVIKLRKRPGYRLRVGDYRVIFLRDFVAEVHDDAGQRVVETVEIVQVIHVGHRRDVYA